MNTQEFSKLSEVFAKTIRNEFEATRDKFHTLLASLSEEDFERQSLNPGWTNGEILAHMTFGFMIVDVHLPMTRLWGKLPKVTSKSFAWLLNLFASLSQKSTLGAQNGEVSETLPKAGEKLQHFTTG